MRPYGAVDDEGNNEATQGGGAEDSSVVVYRPYTPDDTAASLADAPTSQYAEPAYDATPQTLQPSFLDATPDPVLEADEAIITDVDAGRDLGQDAGADDWAARVPINPVTPVPVLPVAPVVPVTHQAPVTSVARALSDDDAGWTAGSGYDAPATGLGDGGGDDVTIPDDPEAIRAGIEQTRAEMSDTINAIQEKLNPQILMDQAKDTLQDAASNIINNAKDTVRDATVGRVEHMVSNVTDTGGNFVQMVKDNPIPAALVGLGLGWLFTRNSGSSNKGRDYRYSASYRDYPDYTDRGYPGAGSYQPQSYGRQAYGSYSGGQGDGDGLVDQVSGRIKQNPVPAALAAAGLGWLLMGGGSNTQSSEASYARYGGGGYSGQRGYGSQGGGIGDAVGQVQGKVGDVADQARDTAGDVASKVGDVAGQVRDTAGNVAGQVRDTAGEVAGTVAQTAGDVAGQTGDVASRFLRTLSENPIPAALAGISLGWLYMQSNSQGRVRLHEARHVAGDVASQAGDTVGRLAETAGETVGNVAEGVKYQASETQSQFQRMLLENPLAVGAIAVAVGAAVGLAVPETPQEHQLMGSARDKLVDRAQSVAQDTLQKVQQATGDAMQRVEEVAGDVQNTVEERASEIGQA